LPFLISTIASSTEQNILNPICFQINILILKIEQFLFSKIISILFLRLSKKNISIYLEQKEK
jgi:hypothetical protein